jgi:hypothetical protein
MYITFFAYNRNTKGKSLMKQRFLDAIILDALLFLLLPRRNFPTKVILTWGTSWTTISRNNDSEHINLEGIKYT